MKAYWDSSALVEAVQNLGVRKALRKVSGFTRPHALAEVFSTLTGGRLGYRCQPDDAAKISRELASDLQFVELDEQETLHALATSRKHGVRGGQIHDYLHAIAARKAGALTIYTFNTGDFRSLGLSLTIVPPPCL
ncbi:MAG: PIN domain-containing protein [Verrucomicrobiae bacterium]